MQPTSTVSDDLRPWRAGAWIGWTALVVIEAVTAALVSIAISFGASSTCREPGRTANLVDGQRDLWIAAAVLAGPWLFAVFFGPRRWRRFVLGWLLGVVPILLMAVTHTRPQDWTGSFCF